ncbi:hypothetical protein RRG08_058811 [Elysia crispata]|uniref:Uncharacterized protein n=1 Tax=Elysia crispata TaxID=231223 RepID=A0AAE0YWN4_9GAST|nr:hypothetical protein RRG08_058811 [Elysia crispata]
MSVSGWTYHKARPLLSRTICWKVQIAVPVKVIPCSHELIGVMTRKNLNFVIVPVVMKVKLTVSARTWHTRETSTKLDKS